MQCPHPVSPPTCISTSNDLLRLIKAINEATLCLGNPDEKFITICQARGGKLKGAGGAGDVAFIDASPVVDTTGKAYDCTVRRVDCELLCERSGQYPLRCNSCQPYRSTLHSEQCVKVEIIALPSDRTLSDYTHWMTPRNGVQLEFVEQLLSLPTA